jgi:hypothetical protein
MCLNYLFFIIQLLFLNYQVEPIHSEQETKFESLPRESDFTRPLVSKLSTISIPLHSSTQTSARISMQKFTDSDVSQTSSDKSEQ